MNGLPYLALAMAALAGVLLNVSRWLGASGILEPGDDTPFDLIVSVPFVLLAGVVLAFVARARGLGPRRVANAALLLNGGVLILLVAIAAIGLANSQGR